jgi:hypothetical protein
LPHPGHLQKEREHKRLQKLKVLSFGEDLGEANEWVEKNASFATLPDYKKQTDL